MQIRRSAGPVVYFDLDTDEPVAKCATHTVYCDSLVNGCCTYRHPHMMVPHDYNTPAWCKMLKGALEDARELRDFERMGLTEMTRQQLAEMVKTIPAEFRPPPQLHKPNTWWLMRAIRKAKLAESAEKKEDGMEMTHEQKTRLALSWAIPETVLRLPPALQNADAWLWDADDVSLYYWSGDETLFRFHVAGKMIRSGKVRIAVMSVEDHNGKATWEADIPADAAIESQA